jgi:hypothetical protein
VAVVVVATAPARAQSSFVIRTSDGSVARIGALRLRRSPTLAAAIRVFGAPSSRWLTSNDSRRVDGRRIRLRIDFANFGGHGPGQTTCSPSVGRTQSFMTRGSRFRTSAGLRVGARTETITELYPGAEFMSDSWWLVTAVSPFGDESEYAVVRALVSRGRVRALAGWIGAAGE